jgi:hypothetical protein
MPRSFLHSAQSECEAGGLVQLASPFSFWKLSIGRQVDILRGKNVENILEKYSRNPKIKPGVRR